MPNGIGRAWLVPHVEYLMVTVVDIAIIEADTNHVSNFYLNELFNTSEHIHKCETLAGGTTRKRISKKVLSNIGITVPSISLISQFDKIAYPIYEIKNNISLQNQKLKAARDILLPRLMNRTIEV